jgi:hypothetical protein
MGVDHLLRMESLTRDRSWKSVSLDDQYPIGLDVSGRLYSVAIGGVEHDVALHFPQGIFEVQDRFQNEILVEHGRIDHEA